MNYQKAMEKIVKEQCGGKRCNDGCMYGGDRCEYGVALSAMEELERYHKVGPTPEQLEEIDKMFYELCRELAKNKKKQEVTACDEDNEMLQILQPMMEHICDNLCVMPKKGYDKEKLDEACAGCELSQHIRNILNTYDKVNSFGKTQAAKLMEKYSSITLCEECEYRAPIKATDDYWCRLGNGIDGSLNPGDGCSRGKRKEDKD